MIRPATSHLILPKHILDIMDIKHAYPGKQEFETCVEMQSKQGVLIVMMPFSEFKKAFEIALGVSDA